MKEIQEKTQIIKLDYVCFPFLPPTLTNIEPFIFEGVNGVEQAHVKEREDLRDGRDGENRSQMSLRSGQIVQ